MVADGVNRIPFFFRSESLIVVDELFCQLSECQIPDLVLIFNELSKCQTHIVITGVSSFCPVYADTGFEVVTDNIRHFHEGHLRFHAALKEVFHIGGVKINLTVHKVVKSIVYR